MSHNPYGYDYDCDYDYGYDYGYTTRKGIQPISWPDFHGICKALAKAVAQYRPEIILPIGRGGYYNLLYCYHEGERCELKLAKGT
jgi:hypothetical protein